MNFPFSSWLFKLLPAYYQREDNNKDGNDRGTLERYLGIVGDAVNDEIPLVEDLLKNVIDIAECNPRFLNHIAYTLGNPPDVMNTEALYRKLLSYIMSIYKIKGTIPSYQYFFNLLGFSVFITEYNCISVLYDNNQTYDSDPAIFYDKYCCTCSDYSIAFSGAQDSCLTNTYFPVSQTTLSNLIKVVFFLEPINAHLRSLDYLIKFCDEVAWCYEDNFLYDVRIYDSYDIGLLYDDLGSVYDDYLSFESDSIADTSCSPNPPGGPFLLQENNSPLLQEIGSRIIIT